MRLRILNIICTLIAAGVLGGGGYYLYQQRLSVDTVAPVITMEDKDIECSINATKSELTEGVKASDDVDGDLSDQIIISGIKIKKETIGKEEKEFEITYVVFDSSNNMVSASRTLRYTDYYSPRFELSNSMQFEAPSSVKILDYVKAEDCIDGNISGQIKLEMASDVNSFGTYSCMVNVENSLGDYSELPLTFKVVDTTSDEEETRPSIGLTDYVIYLQKGEEMNPTDYLSTVTINKMTYKLLETGQVEITEDTAESGYGYSDVIKGSFMLKDAISYTSDVDVDVAGIYTVRYSYRHPTEGTLGSTELMVIVE